MILATKLFKEICSNILTALDTNEFTTLKDTVELKTEGTTLYLNVTNREYYVSAKIKLDHEEPFHVTVAANQFLKLIATMTTETVELTSHGTYMTIKANGTYKLPFIFEGDHLLELPKITITNATATTTVSGDTLNSILQYNGKEIAKASVVQPVQKLYYLDEEGCITFTTGACVNSFKLSAPIKVLLSNKVVRLFKLFKKDTVTFTLGYDPVPNSDVLQTKVRFETDAICLTAITPSTDQLLSKVPVEKIRSLANKTRGCKAVLNKEAFLQAVTRLALFNSNDTLDFVCDKDSVTIRSGENAEQIKVENGSSMPEDMGSYAMLVNLTNLRTVLESCTEQFVTMGYGDHTAITITRTAVCNVIPESLRR